MTSISIIAALDEKRGIGKDNNIPWRIREDLKHLASLTAGQTVVLGRKTYESMAGYYDRSGRSMPGGKYLIVTKNKEFKPIRPNCIVVHSIQEAIEKTVDQKEIFVIGGADIFSQTINMADKLYLTLVKGDFNADTFFPEYADFKVISERPSNEGDQKYTFLVLTKNAN